MPGTTSAAGDAAVRAPAQPSSRKTCVYCLHFADLFAQSLASVFTIPATSGTGSPDKGLSASLNYMLCPLCFCGPMCGISADQALKSVKGVLNKLTPEKFDRLLGLLVAAVTSVDVLNGLIKLVFDNAVRVMLSLWQSTTSTVSTVPCRCWRSVEILHHADVACAHPTRLDK
jgi:hypothetical protein